ncbi:MAG: hypothetical protein R2706_12595 [Acidimicrobiales bacterium]
MIGHSCPNTKTRINNKIRAREVRLISADGEQLGIVPLPQALSKARELDLDLVEVADKAHPPGVASWTTRSTSMNRSSGQRNLGRRPPRLSSKR